MTEEQEPTRDGSWKLRIALFAGLIVLLFLGYVVSVTLVPRAWGQFMGNRIDGRMTVGTAYGLVIGFVFTLIPLYVARQAFRSVTWRTRGVILLVAALLAIPNLMTLGIAKGDSNGSHAGERILDVDGPGFRNASAFGAVFGVLAMVAILVLRWRMSRADRPSRELRDARAAVPED